MWLNWSIKHNELFYLWNTYIIIILWLIIMIKKCVVEEVRTRIEFILPISTLFNSIEHKMFMVILEN